MVVLFVCVYSMIKQIKFKHKAICYDKQGLTIISHVIKTIMTNNHLFSLNMLKENIAQLTKIDCFNLQHNYS